MINTTKQSELWDEKKIQNGVKLFNQNPEKVGWMNLDIVKT